MRVPLNWTHTLSEVGPEGLSRARTAAPGERAALATALEILAVGGLDVCYDIKPLGSGRYRLSGDLAARVTQACVVTLEAVQATVADRFAVEFWPPNLLPAAPSGETELSAAPDIEPLDGHAIDVGRIVFEIVSAGLDPYPRAPGSVFAAPDAEETSGAGAPGGPFAVLGNLKK